MTAYQPTHSKKPARCPHCDAGPAQITKRGTRRKKLGRVQLWRCGACDRSFSEGSQTLRFKTFPPRVIIEALELYCRGHTLAETSARLKNKIGARIAPATISSWLAEFAPLISYRRLRDRSPDAMQEDYSPASIIRRIKLHHKQVYDFSYHRAKLDLLRAGVLDTKRSIDTSLSSARFASLADFLERVPQLCPHELFTREDGARGSQLESSFLDLDHLRVNMKENAATAAAAFVLPTLGSNFLRHPTLQRFMLATDSATVAVEVPIWLTEEDVASLERGHRVTLIADSIDPATQQQRPRSITGHIDFVQVRNGAVHILDYKPDARTNKPMAQLAIYALALTRLASLNLFDIKCAWFNEHEYNEFFPRTALKRSS